MASSELPFGIDRSRLRLDGKDPYLCLHFVIIFVRDQERSLRFFADKLGFRVAVDHTFENGNRWIEVAPPDGTAQLGIAVPPPGSEPEKLIGGLTDIYFITEDLPGKYKEWSERGVRFQFPPEVPAWGGIHTRFEDPDGNSFGLVGFDELTRGVETHRRALAQKLETERRTAQELEIAQQVQARLLPQIHPETETLEYAGLCLPARQVGGDYFDFLDLGQQNLGQQNLSQQLGLVIGDVSGKGIAAALLMANLQANLRSQYAIAVDDLPRLLTSVNRLFYENTDDASYATLFFADYDDSTRKLRYANCGHLPPVLLRANSLDQASKPPTVDWLNSTCTVMGLFEAWQCEIAEVQLAPGDTLVLYTDGVTEAENAEGEEFGASRLLDTLKSHAHLPVGPLLQAVVAAVQQFSGGSEQQDDITLVIARSLT